MIKEISAMNEKINRKRFDLHNYEGKLQKTMKNVQKADFLSDDVKNKFIEWKDSQTRNDLKTPSICKNIEKAYTVFRQFLPKKAVKDYTKKDIERAVTKIMEGKYADYTKALYKIILKLFFKFAGRTELIEGIKTNVKKSRFKLPEELLSEQDILAIIDKCENYRDRALIALLYETGCRIGELSGIQLKDLEFHDGEATVTLQGKTGMRKVLLLFCVPYLKKFLEIRSEWNKKESKPLDKEAYLFLGQGTKNKGAPLTYQAIRTQLKRIMKRAKLNKPCNPHHFRHSRASYLANHLTESQLCTVMGWELGSDMPRVYIHLSGRDINNSLRQLYGGKTKEVKESLLKTKKCEICLEINEPDTEVCSKCGNPLSVLGAVKRSEELKVKEKQLNVIVELVNKVGDLEKMLNQLTAKQAKEILEKY